MSGSKPPKTNLCKQLDLEEIGAMSVNKQQTDLHQQTTMSSTPRPAARPTTAGTLTKTPGSLAVRRNTGSTNPINQCRSPMTPQSENTPSTGQAAPQAGRKQGPKHPRPSGGPKLTPLTDTGNMTEANANLTAMQATLKRLEGEQNHIESNE